jgi:hypothetical protein
LIRFHPLLKTIANSRVLTLFSSGYIKGFVSRAQAKSLLSSSPPGTAIIRFSQTNPSNIVFT